MVFILVFTLVLQCFIPGGFHGLNYASTSTVWTEIAPNTSEAIDVYSHGSTIALIQKNAVFFGNEGNWSQSLQAAFEIDTAFKALDGKLYVVSSKKGNALYKSEDHGATWINLVSNGSGLPTSFSGAKVEGLYVDETGIYLSAEKKGIFHSADEGQTWTDITKNLSKSNEDFNIRWIGKHSGNLFVATKKQGINICDLTNSSAIWEAYNSNFGLTGDSKEIFTGVFYEDQLIIGTKKGVYTTSAVTNQTGYQQIPNLSDEVKYLEVSNGKLHATAKDSKNVFVYDFATKFEALNLPSNNVSREEPKGLAIDGSTIYMAHKKGLLKVEYIINEIEVADVANQINSITQPYANVTSLVLPSVPTGFSIAIESSSHEDIVKLNGSIEPPASVQTVNLIFRVTKLSTGESALTNVLSVTIPQITSTGNDDGIYQGVGKGKNGDITVQVTVVGQLIIQIDVLSHKESSTHSEYGVPVTLAINEIPNRIIETQSLTVDSITSATKTSQGIVLAVKDALKTTSLNLGNNNSGNGITTIWENINADATEGKTAFDTSLGLIYVGKVKDQKKANVLLVNHEGLVTPKITNIPEIETGYKVPNSDTVFLMGNKEAKVLIYTTDGGNTWSEIIEPSGLPSEKVESLLVLDNGVIIVTVSKHGVYVSDNGGGNFTSSNGNLPVSPEKSSEYDVRKLMILNNEYYALTKKQGVLKSVDLVNWVSLNKEGLTSDGLDVWDIEIFDNQMVITGKNGVWINTIQGDQMWQRISGYTGEARELIRVEGILYVFTKDLSVYFHKDNQMVLLGGKPSLISGETPTSSVLMNDWIYVSHKGGLFRIKKLVASSLEEPIDTDTDTDTDTGASQLQPGGGTDVDTSVSVWQPVTSGALVTPLQSSTALKTQVDDHGKVVAKIELSNIKTMIKNNPKLATIELKLPENTKNFEVKIERDVWDSVREANPEAILQIKYDLGSYSMPVQWFTLTSDETQLGKFLGATIEIIEVSGDVLSEIQKVTNSHLQVPPVEYKVTATYEKGDKEVQSFGTQFIDRSVYLDNETDISSSIGVVFEDGKWVPVPTRFAYEDGKQVAVISRNSNSIYSVITLDKRFEDIEGHIAETEIKRLASKGIVDGLNNQFMPDKTLTRAEFSALIVKAFGLKLSTESTITFRDVDSESWYAPYVYTAAQYQLVTGNSQGLFSPNQVVNREQMVAMVINAIKTFKGTDATSITERPVGWIDGIYNGIALGAYGTDLSLNIVVRNGKIEAVEKIVVNETPSIGTNGVDFVINQVISEQTYEVDGLTGATVSSNAAKLAIKRALVGNEVVSSYVNFEDDALISDWAIASVQFAAQNKMISAFIDGTFKPQNDVTRAEAAVILNQLLIQFGW